jgi:S-formylglutathione hydrolase FrmB
MVYLPPSYDAEPKKRYPTMYLLHGNNCHNTVWTDGSFQGIRLHYTMDALIERGDAAPMIAVMPDAHNRYHGSHYVNSSVTGNWADFVAHDLVSYIDKTYRTIPQPKSRGLTGHSMGGRGAIYLSMTRPKVFSAIYGQNAGQMNFGSVPKSDPEWWYRLLSLRDLELADSRMKRMIGLAAAFAPNPDRPPFYVDFHFRLKDGQIQFVPEVWRRWLAFDPVALVPSCRDNLRSLRGINLDCGLSDIYTLDDNRAFSRALTDAGIPHSYTEHDGDHVNRVRDRLESSVFPFFSEVLAQS